uniref:Otopetrin 3 n=1 Tax=Monopterus albus TaxID=43700 RepID=A0A3Q3JYQ4_MONAL|nr:otopetrin-3-like [Monopterus albus]
MDRDPGAIGLSSFRETPENPATDELDNQLRIQDEDPGQTWVLYGQRLTSSLLGLNVVLLGAALVGGQAFDSNALKYEEPQVFILLLVGISLIWILWYLLWVRKQPGINPHKDHHAGGITVISVLIVFASVSLLLHIFRTGYLMSVKECTSAPTLISPFMEAPFLALQTYLLWVHSKDCIHKHKMITRLGLMVVLAADLLLWLNAVTEDSIHTQIELEKNNSNIISSEDDSSNSDDNSTLCKCNTASCLIFRKGFEILYPFNIEYYLMASCMIYVMWKNVGRKTGADHHTVTQKLTLHIISQGRVICGLVFGTLALLSGMAIFILYQVWVSQHDLRFTAFLMFYSYHLVIMPLMSLCCLVGILVHKLERRAHIGGHNPTLKLDVFLLVGAAVGQIALSYFSLVSALAVGTGGLLGDLDLSYSLLSLLELILQNIFIIEGLHRHPHLSVKKKGKQKGNLFKFKKKPVTPAQEGMVPDTSSLKGNTSAPPADQEHDGEVSWTKRVIQEICAFLILSNIMLWVIPAFGVHPQLEDGLGKQFFGFSAWFILVNLGQPLIVFYRMHSVAALLEVLTHT